MINTELALTTLAAMLSPTTLSFSVLALLLGEKPRRTGIYFYVGAMGATLAVGIVAAFVLGNKAASHHTSTPKTWVAIFDIVAGALLLVWVLRLVRRPRDPKRAEKMFAQMGRIASSPAVVIVGAGAALANPGGFIPVALKEISQTDPSTARYIVDWIVFSIVSLLPLLVAIVLLFVAPARTQRILQGVRDWLFRSARTVAAVIIVLLAATLLYNGITGL
ncbi:MAG TPA: GAP family protein [Acidimicrobiia bacterium]|nr:GAP family protein [Acidimicrobiia bacterium]